MRWRRICGRNIFRESLNHDYHDLERILEPQGRITISATSGSSLSSPRWADCSSARTGSSSAARSRFLSAIFNLTSDAQIRLGEQLRAHRLPRRRAGRGRVERQIRPQTIADHVGIFVCGRLPSATRLRRHFSIFVAWRMLGGVAIGLASNLSPMYIAEVAPAQMRGKLVSINQLTIVIGVLAAQLINWSLVRNLPQGASDEFIVNSWFGQSGWRWMFAHHRRSRRAVFCRNVFRSRKPALAGEKRKARRAQRRF